MGRRTTEFLIRFALQGEEGDAVELCEIDTLISILVKAIEDEVAVFGRITKGEPLPVERLKSYLANVAVRIGSPELFGGVADLLGCTDIMESLPNQEAHHNADSEYYRQYDPRPKWYKGFERHWQKTIDLVRKWSQSWEPPIS